MADDVKQAWSNAGVRFASFGKRLSDRYREAGPAAAAEAREAQRTLEDAAKEIGAQLSRAMDAVGATIRDDEAKADLKQAVSAVGEALGATFDEAALALRGVIGSKDDETPPPPPPPDDDGPGSTPAGG
jgi:hypothetical protein